MRRPNGRGRKSRQETNHRTPNPGNRASELDFDFWRMPSTRCHIYWAPTLQECPISPPKYEKVASAFAWLVFRAANWNALQAAQQ